MFWGKVNCNLFSYGQSQKLWVRLISCFKKSEKRLLIARRHFSNLELEKNESVGNGPRNFEGDYFRKVMSNGLKYPACSFIADPAVFNENSTNGLVSMLRNLARGGEWEVSGNGTSATENFSTDLFTLDDFIEILYLLSIPGVSSRVPYKREDLRKFIGNKYKLVRHGVGNDPSKHLILLNLLRKNKFYSSDISFYVVDAIRKRHKIMLGNQIIEFFYFLHFFKTKHANKSSKFDFEEQLARKICNFSLDEVAIIAYGFFRSQNCPGRLLFCSICERIEKEVSNWNEVQASVFSKFLCLCGRYDNNGTVHRILEKFVHIMDNFRLITLIHVSCLGINCICENRELLNRVIERATREISTIRLKDIERLLLACLYANIPLTEDSEFVRVVIENLETREDEIRKYNRAFESLLQYLIMYGVYLEDLISSALSEDNLLSVGTSKRKTKMHELLYIDTSLEIERPSYKGNRLPEQLRKKIARKFANTYNAEEAYSYKCTATIGSILGKKYGEANCVKAQLMPHHATYCPVLCFNENNESQIVQGRLDANVGTIAKPPKDGNRWLCFVVVLPKGYLSDGSTPNFVTRAKLRHLEAIGYTPILIRVNKWKRRTEDINESYLLNTVEKALKKNE